MIKRITSMVLAGVASAIIALYCTGCSGWLLGDGKYTPVQYYGLAAPVPLAYQGVSIHVYFLKMLSASSTRMQYRDSDYSILVDEYNKWIDPPESMLSQFLQVAFSNDAGKPIDSTRNTYVMSGTITIFEINLNKRQVALGMDYKLVSELNDSFFSESSRLVTHEFTEATPGAFASAISAAAGKLSTSIMQDAVAIEKRRQEAMQKDAAGKK